jgi:predicted TIM-barrel fold metal-dependent hydrolase
MPNLRTAGHYDVHTRLRDMDRDGVAGEVIFHSSQNWEPIPFVHGGGTPGMYELEDDPELAAVGQHIYNRWLVDMITVEPERHAGLAYLPMWDLDAAIREMEWAAASGLKGVNFPAPRPDIVEYDQPLWEPFWDACEDLGMVLTTHAGGRQPGQNTRHTLSKWMFEAGWLARRALPWMIYSGVFERHPRLKLVFTEQIGEWWPAYERDLDSFCMPATTLPKLASEYLNSNVFIGGSFLSNFEAVHAVEGGYATRLMWGSDYPHGEGTYCYGPNNEESMTRTSLRFTFAGVRGPLTPRPGFPPPPSTSPILPDDVRLIVGENAAQVYGFDLGRLGEVAARIQAPALEELTRPLEAIPARGGMLAFRLYGALF